MKFLIAATVFWMVVHSLCSADKIQESHISTKTSVIFNTLCAKCHEGECSGRLSFDTGSRTAARHIRHYAEVSNLSRKEIEEFFSLLDYMKRECAIYMPDHEKWKKQTLSRFALSSKRGYFIPLGRLKPGRYSMTLEMSVSAPFRIEVMTDKIENLLDRSVSMLRTNSIFQFRVDKPAAVFVRIRSRKALSLTAFHIQPN